MSDDDWMLHCLTLARKAEGKTSPNPIVGAVVLDKRGRLVGEGYHKRAGLAHAEKVALEMAGNAARGGTLFTNLEPCRHLENRRTSPCAPLLLEAGIARLVVGHRDPIAAHAGGAAWLKKQGLAVTLGVLRSQCEQANHAFLTWVGKDRPLFILKVGSSLDGKIATSSGESKWITGPKARADGRRLRGKLDAILVGVNTVIADDPRLTTRGRGMRDPIRIVLDTRLRTPVSAQLLPAYSGSKARVIIATCASPKGVKAQHLAQAGAEILSLPKKAGKVCLTSLGKALGRQSILSTLVEGGAETHAAFLAAGLCDELRIYLAPIGIGGSGKSWLGGRGIESLADAHQMCWYGEPRKLGPDLLLVARPR